MRALRDVGYCRRVRISRQRGRGVILAGVGVAAAAIGLLAWGAGTLDRLERVSVDQRFQVRGDLSLIHI